jgi:hypothetical protein
MSRAWAAPDRAGAIVVAMRRTLTLILGVALFGILAAVVVASQGADDPAGTTDTVTDTVERTTTVEDNPDRVRDDDDAGGDISGPCDEAEHANDPRCTGQGPAAGDDRAPAQGGDISGPCDEAEHAIDPRCTGAPTGGRLDNSGPGSLNSGPGSVDSGHDDDGDDDRRGRGSGDDSGGDDHGGGGNSGPGGGGDDD